MPWYQGSWGQHGALLGPTGPRWAPCWPHELCYLGGKCFLSFKTFLTQRDAGRFFENRAAILSDVIFFIMFVQNERLKKIWRGHLWLWIQHDFFSSWRYRMETISALLALCVGNSPVTNASDAVVWCSGWVNNRDAGDFKRHRAHYDVTVMLILLSNHRAQLWRSLFSVYIGKWHRTVMPTVFAGHVIIEYKFSSFISFHSLIKQSDDHI